MFYARFALLRAGLRRKEGSLSFAYPALTLQRASAPRPYWAILSSRLAALLLRSYGLDRHP